MKIWFMMINVLAIFSSQGLPPPVTRTTVCLRWLATLCRGQMKNNSETKTLSAQPGSGLQRIPENCTTNRALQTLKTSHLTALCPKQKLQSPSDLSCTHSRGGFLLDLNAHLTARCENVNTM